MKLIDISTPKHPNTFTMVDDADYGEINKWHWMVSKVSNNFYAIRWMPGGGRNNQTLILMHREILKSPPKTLTDHRDGNGLNNQRSNLRICTSLENRRNSRKILSRKSRKTTSRFIGVVAVKARKKTLKYIARISICGVKMNLGTFRDELRAALAYDAAAKKYHGEFARLNVPEPTLYGGGNINTPTQGGKT